MVLLLDAGVSVRMALERIQTDESQKWFQQQVAHIRQDVEKGMPLATAMRHILPPEVSLRMITTDSGKIQDYLNRLGQYFSHKGQTIQKLQKELRYPMFLTAVLLVNSIVMGGFLVPKYLRFFQESGMSLPLSIRLLERSYRVFTLNPLAAWTWVGAGAGALAWAVKSRLKPWVYRLIFHVGISDMYWQLGILLSAKCSINQALDTVGLNDKTPFAKPFQAFKRNVLKTGQFVQELTRCFPCPATERELLAQAEKTGNLGPVLVRVAARIDAEDQARMAACIQVIQPCLLGLVGILTLVWVYITVLPLLASIQNLGVS